MLTKTLAALAAMTISGMSHAEWVRASSRHFVVYANDRPEAVKAYTTKLERFDSAMRSLLGLQDPEVSPSARVRVYILPTEQDVQRSLGAPSGVAGVYQDQFPTSPFAVVPKRDSGDGSERALTPLEILLHEYTHHIMYSTFGDVAIPTWFSEGFAELFATARFDADGGVVFGTPPMYRAYGIDKSNVFPIMKLVRHGPDYRDSLQAQVFYGRSWLLTNYLMFNKDRAKQLGAYIAAINSGKSTEEALHTLDVTPALDMKLDSYAQHRTGWPSSRVAPAAITTGDVTVQPLGAGEAAVMPAFLRSNIGVNSAQASATAALARTLAAPFPNDAAAQNELAEAEHDAGQYAASEAAADRALATDPTSVHALIYKGLDETELLKKSGNKDPQAWTKARRIFLAANRLEPLYSYPPQLFYESFRDAGQTPSPAAVNGLLYAYRLRPELASIRIAVVKEMLKAGNRDAARVALEPIAYSPHGGQGADIARKVLEALTVGGTAAAQEAMSKAEEEAKKKQTAKSDILAAHP